MPKLHCRVVTWNPVFAAYTPLPDGIKVQVRRQGLLSEPLSEAVLRGGRVLLNLPEGEAVDITLDTGGQALRWKSNALVPAGSAGAFLPPQPWVSPLGHRRPQGQEGSEQQPFVLRAGRDAFLRFVRWDDRSGQFRPAPAGLRVQAWDKDPVGQDLLGEALTDAEGRATFSLHHAAEGAPDLFFTVSAPEGRGHIDASGVLSAPGPHTQALPLPWSSREGRSLKQDDQQGYWEDFTGQRIGTPDSPYCFALDAERPRTWTGNQARLLIDGVALLQSWERLIDSAKHSIHFEVMLYFDDPMARRIQQKLVQKAKQGVRVRLLIGAQVTQNIASLIQAEKAWARLFRTLEGEALTHTLEELDKEYTEESRRCDTVAMMAELDDVPNLSWLDSSFKTVEVLPGVREGLPSAYQALEDKLPFFALARVDHRKLLIIDGKVAVVGGQNVGREYIYERPFNPAVPDGQEEWCKWHDVSVELRGPAVRELQERFRERWVSEGGDPFPFGPSAEGRGTDPQHPCFPRLDPQPENLRLRVIDTTPGARFGWHQATLQGLRAAKREVFITNPYFSSPETQALLCATARRGVRVVLVLPDQRNDSIDFLYAARLWYAELLQAGVEVYEYQNHMCHAKVAIYDDTSIIGTANLNHSSYFYHYELAVFIEDAAFTQNFRSQMWDKDLPRCKRIQAKDIPALLDINPLAELYLRNIVHKRF